VALAAGRHKNGRKKNQGKSKVLQSDLASACQRGRLLVSLGKGKAGFGAVEKGNRFLEEKKGKV